MSLRRQGDGLGFMRSIAPLLFALLLLSGCAGRPGESPPDSSPEQTEQAAPGLVVETACIPVHLEGASAGNVVGTLYRKAGASLDKVLLFSPGVQTTRGAYDVPLAGQDANATFARTLALAGQPILVFDRPGTGDSAWQPDANDPGMTMARLVEGFDQLVLAMKQGTWQLVHDASCAGGTAGARIPLVALGGHSLGGLLSMEYATRYGNADGFLIVAADSDGRFNDRASAMGLYCASNADPEGKTYQAFCPNPIPGATCPERLVVPSNVDQATVDAFCATLSSARDPISPVEFASSNPLAIQSALLAGTVRPVPIHFLFMETEGILSMSGQELRDQTDELQRWTGGCPECAVTSFTVSETGHGWVMHYGQEAGFRSVIDWLASLTV